MENDAPAPNPEPFDGPLSPIKSEFNDQSSVEENESKIKAEKAKPADSNQQNSTPANANGSEWDNVSESGQDEEELLDIVDFDPEDPNYDKMVEELVQKSIAAHGQKTESDYDQNIIPEDLFEEFLTPCIINRYQTHDEAIMSIAVDPRCNRYKFFGFQKC